MRGILLYTGYFLILALLTGYLVWHFQYNFEPKGKLIVQVQTDHNKTEESSYHFSILCPSDSSDRLIELDDGIRILLIREFDKSILSDYCNNPSIEVTEYEVRLKDILMKNKSLKLKLKNSIGSQVRSFFKSTSESALDSVTIYTDWLSAKYLLPQLESSKWVDIYLNDNSYIASQVEN